MSARTGQGYRHLPLALSSSVAAALLVACGGGGGSSLAATYKLGGTVTGLDGGGVVLEVAGQTVTTAYGATTFEFPNGLEAGTAYNVTIKGQPSPQRCTLANGTGTMGGADVSSVAVSCSNALAVSEVHRFVDATEGRIPTGTLVEGPDGLLYGSLYLAGSSGGGSLFKMTTSGQVTVLHAFGSSDTTGYAPYRAPLLGRDGALYGAASEGTASRQGALFKWTTSGGATLVRAFGSSTSDSKSPCSALVEGSDGSLYGTATAGGTTNLGTIFKVSTAGVLQVLHTFAGGSGDGANPECTGVVFGVNGQLYGMTPSGGAHGGGVIFKMATDGSGYSIVHNFDTPRLSGPLGDLTLARDGSLYGMSRSDGTAGKGTVFKVSPTDVVTVLHNFAGGANDGASPDWKLLEAADGNFYGITLAGGANDSGAVFQMTPAGSVKVLRSLPSKTGSDDLARGGLMLASDGALYGTLPAYDLGPTVRAIAFKIAVP